MSKRNAIWLAIGLLVLGLFLGFVAGGVATRFFMRRTLSRSFGAGQFAPRAFYGAPGLGHGTMPMVPRGYGRGGMPFGGGRMQPRAMPGRGVQPRRAPVNAIVNGARVASVESNSAADRAGLKVGDVITAVAGTNIDPGHSFPSLLQSRKPGDKIDLTVSRAGQVTTIGVTLGASPQNSSAAYLGIRYGPAFQRQTQFR
jgi:membrane-associated protease RseP (regulator of RpoE activity)